MMAMSYCRSLLQGGQVGDELVDLGLGQPEGGHAPYLARRRSASTYIGFIAGALRIQRSRSARLRHSSEVPVGTGRLYSAGFVHSGSFRSNEPPAKVVRLMRWVRLGAAPATTWAAAFGGRERLAVGVGRARRPGGSGRTAAMKVVSPGRATSSVGVGGVLQLVRHPRVPVGLGRQRDHAHAHVGVGQAAELGALAPVLARLVGLACAAAGRGRARRRACRSAAGIQNEWMTSRLVIDSWTGLPAGITISPEVTIGSPSASLSVRVVELPPPLLADDGDLEGVGRPLGQVEDRDDGGHGHGGQEHRRGDGPHDLEPGVAVELRGERLVARPCGPGTSTPRTPTTAKTSSADDGGQDVDEVEVGDLLRVGALGLEDVLRGVGVGRAAGRHHEPAPRRRAGEEAPGRARACDERSSGPLVVRLTRRRQ